jgi:hypothetical protein
VVVVVQRDCRLKKLSKGIVDAVVNSCWWVQQAVVLLTLLILLTVVDGCSSGTMLKK